MKKNKIIGLGVCALALGVVAGAVSAKRALEVKADGVPANVYIALGEGSAWKSWGLTSANVKAHFFFGVDEALTQWPGNAVSETVINKVTYMKVAVPSGAAKMVVTAWGGETNQNKTEDLTIPTDGKNLFTVTSNNNSAVQTGTWSTLDTQGEQQIIDDETKHDFKIVGSSAALGEWKAANGLAMTKDAGDGYLARALNVSLKAGDKFKAVDVDADGWYGNDGLRVSDAALAKLTSDKDGNFVAAADVNFDIYLRTNHCVDLILHGEELSALKTPVAADGYYILGATGWNPVFGIKDDKGQESANIAEFHNVSLSAGDTFKIVDVKNGAGEEYIGYEAFVNAASGAASDMTDKIELAEGDAKANFTVVASGTYSIYVFWGEDQNKNPMKLVSIVDEKYVPVKDVYTVTIGDADPVALEENDKNPGEYMVTGATLTKGAVISFKLNNEALAVAPKAGEGNNVELVEENLVIRMSGTGGIYLSQNESKWEVWVGGYVTPDVDVVDNFVATYITAKIDENWKTQDAATRAASCEAKYDAAKAALEKLTQAQQDLFAADERYGDARAKYEAWGVACGKITLVGNPSALKDSSNSGLIIALAATGLVAATGISIFFATRKKKAE